MNPSLDLPQTKGRLLIREFTGDDRACLQVFLNDPDQLKYMMFSVRSETELKGFLELARTQATSLHRTEWHLALEEKDAPGCIGGVALMMDTESAISAELGYWLKQSAWGKGYATEASRFMLDAGFTILGLHRIYGKCHVENPASAHVMEKLGMQLEGCIREHIWLRDHYRSSLQYSILSHEYRQ